MTNYHLSPQPRQSRRLSASKPPVQRSTKGPAQPGGIRPQGGAHLGSAVPPYLRSVVLASMLRAVEPCAMPCEASGTSVLGAETNAKRYGSCSSSTGRSSEGEGQSQGRARERPGFRDNRTLRRIP